MPNPPLAFDTDFMGSVYQSGFRVVDADGDVDVESIVLSGSNRITLVLAKEPNGDVRLRYGLDYSSSVIDGISSGAVARCVIAMRKR